MKRYKSILFFCSFLLLASIASQGQGAGNIWTFGMNAGIDFNSGAPVPFRSALYSGINEGCATICDASGQLLFYTDGSKVWNRNHTLMPNGNLFPNLAFIPTASTAQGAVIVQSPGNDRDRYYVFSLENRDSDPRGRLYYSVIDLALDNGLGDVVADERAIQIDQQLSERMTAVAGPNCNVWLLVCKKNMGRETVQEYRAYKIDGDGVNTQAVSSLTGTPRSIIGAMKSSPDGKRLVVTGSMDGYPGVELFDFDVRSGKLDNATVVDTAAFSIYRGFYSACFSPDNLKLYASYYYYEEPTYSDNYGRIYQYDLTTPTSAAVIASKSLTYQTGAGQGMVGDIKAGPDGKLYFVRSGGNGMNVINLPNLAGTACQVVPNAFSLAGGTSTYLGLPNSVVVLPARDTFVTSHSVPVCFEDSVVLEVNPSGYGHIWDSLFSGPSYTTGESGNYVSIHYDVCRQYVDHFSVVFSRLPKVTSTRSCPGVEGAMAVALPAERDSLNYEYAWINSNNELLRRNRSSSGDTLRDIIPGSYTLHLKAANGCGTSLSVEVASYPGVQLSVSADTTIRYGKSALLGASGAGQYTWSPVSYLDDPNSQQPIATPQQTTQFTVYGSNEWGCYDTATVLVQVDFNMKECLPDAFSPNGDGRNDLFRLVCLDHQKIAEFRIFNRWGQEVFATLDPRKGWDGNYNGSPQETGAYYYVLKLKVPDGSSKAIMGDITLVR